MTGKTSVGCMIFIAWSLVLVQAEHKVVAVVLKNPSFQGVPVLKLNAHKVLSAPSDQASIQQTTPLVANAVNPVATPNFAENSDAPVPVIHEKPKKVIRYKLIRLSDEDIKKEKEAKKKKQLQDAEDARLKKLFYPCRDYSPVCSWYKNKWNPSIAQCRDVWMQRNCRETCGLCRIPVGVYLACQDMWHCKKLATHSCVHDWVRETCKSMCGTCDGSKGHKYARVGASSVFVGKRKSVVEAKKENEDDEKKVKTVHQAVKLQAKPIKVEGPISKETKDDSDADEEDDLENSPSGDGPDDKENDDDDDDDSNDVENQPADSNTDNESGDDEETKDDKSETESKVEAKPAKHASVPKVVKKPEQKPAVQKPVASKVQQLNQKQAAKKVVYDEKPNVNKAQAVNKVHDKKRKTPPKNENKKVKGKKAKTLLDALKKYKKPTNAKKSKKGKKGKKAKFPKKRKQTIPKKN